MNQLQVQVWDKDHCYWRIFHIKLSHTDLLEKFTTCRFMTLMRKNTLRIEGGREMLVESCSSGSMPDTYFCSQIQYPQSKIFPTSEDKLLSERKLFGTIHPPTICGKNEKKYSNILRGSYREKKKSDVQFLFESA